MTDPPPGPPIAATRARTFRRRRLAVGTALALLVVSIGVGIVSVTGNGSNSTGRPARTLPAFVDGTEKRSLAPAFERAARENDLPPALVMALGWRESRWRAEAHNPESGATGIGQLLPETSTYVATELLGDPSLDPTDPRDNIRLMARYLRALTDRFDGDSRLGLASYLQGSTSVAESGVSAQTEAYLADIEEIRARFTAARRGNAGSSVDPLAS